MTSLLRDRVRAALGAPGISPRPSEPTRPALPPLDVIFGATWVETAAGPALVRDEWYPSDHAHGRFSIGAGLARRAALEALTGGPAPRRPAFLDIETTGLAGGVGTCAFLVGVGAWRDEGFRLRQYFLPAPSHETAMLRLLARDLEECDALVTFNGRAFDVPVLESRFALNRLSSPLDRLPHLDLLRPARQVYRFRTESRRLVELEERLLAFLREDDVPGWAIPQMYFDFLRAGRAAPLRLVFRHNRWDVLAMASLLTRLVMAVDGDTDDARERLGVAAWHERRGERARAAGAYAGALPELTAAERAHALRRLALLYRRERRWDEAAALWRELAAAGDPDALIEVAKHLEHRERDYLGALQACERAAALSDSPGLRHRMERLRRKLARRRAEERTEPWPPGEPSNARCPFSRAWDASAWNGGDSPSSGRCGATAGRA
ncbi:MAG TPA: ribonuclease H-like domain-containing protein [Dehalococcoidia bacterium]|nr:ribonuclease H-like domain-containing protein [Dehalococcoidia bacterium]